MALIITLTEKGQSPRIFSIPDDELRKYREVKIEESKLAQPGETVPGTEHATALEAASRQGDLLDVRVWCRCYYRMAGRWWYRDQPCYYPCPPRY